MWISEAAAATFHFHARSCAWPRASRIHPSASRSLHLTPVRCQCRRRYGRCLAGRTLRCSTKSRSYNFAGRRLQARASQRTRVRTLPVLNDVPAISANRRGACPVPAGSSGRLVRRPSSSLSSFLSLSRRFQSSYRLLTADYNTCSNVDGWPWVWTLEGVTGGWVCGSSRMLLLYPVGSASTTTVPALPFGRYGGSPALYGCPGVRSAKIPLPRARGDLIAPSISCVHVRVPFSYLTELE